MTAESLRVAAVFVSALHYYTAEKQAYLNRAPENAGGNTPSAGGAISNSETIVTRRMNTVSSPRALPGQVLEGWRSQVEDNCAEKLYKNYLRPKPKPYEVGSGMSCDSSRNRSGIKACESYCSFGANATALKLQGQ